MTKAPPSPMSTPAFRSLFAAQVCSLMSIGLMTVAMSLLAYRIGGEATAGTILGFLLAVKMVAYVGVAPLAEAVLSRFARKPVMIWLDLARMALLIPMAFATQTWQIAGLAFLFFAVSAAFTPLFQSVIPDLLPNERVYTRALVWSRIAYTLEAVLSPTVAALLLTVLDAAFLFWAASFAFVLSVLALMATRFPQGARERRGTFLKRAGKGLRIYRATPRLRALFLLNLALSLSMAWVLVNSVVFAGVHMGDAERYFPVLMAFYGVGAGIGALIVPRLSDGGRERRVMLAGGVLHAALGLGIVLPLTFSGWLLLWACFGIAASLVLTPGGLVIARSANKEDRAGVFAAQFSLSHAGWLIAYPLAGGLATRIGLEPALLVLSGLTLGCTLVAARVWPVDDPVQRAHDHPELPDGHPHLIEAPATGMRHAHAHEFHIDDLHPEWTVREPG